MNDTTRETLEMTASTIGRDILAALVQEVRLLPDVWIKTPKAKQDDVIERLRKRVDNAVRMAVHLIASDGRAVADATLEQVVFKQGIKAVFTLSANCPTRHQLADSEGKLCLIVVADPSAHLGDMDSIKGESDQRAMDLGTEYDPKGDGKGMDDDSTVVDVEVKALPDTPLQADLDKSFAAGQVAAANGDPKDACPVMRHELVARWVAGWHDWHEKNDDADPSAATGDGGAAQDDAALKDDLYDEAVARVMAKQRASVSFVQRELRIGYNRAARLIEMMEQAGIVSAPNAEGARTVLKTTAEA